MTRRHPARGHDGADNMAYAAGNPKTKKQLREWLETRKVEIYSPGPFPVKQNGVDFVEGPHYPAPHTWYAKVEIKDGLIVKVIS
jgi:hypothetical protein